MFYCSYWKIQWILPYNKIQCISNLVQKIQCIHALHKRQWISEVNQKMQCIHRMKHNVYPTLAQSNTTLSHNWIKTNIHYIKVRIVRIKNENIKLINGEASSTTLVEKLASHDKKNHKETNKIIKIKLLTKELEFKAPKIHKNTETTRNGTLGTSPSIYNEHDDIYNLILRFWCCQVG